MASKWPRTRHAEMINRMRDKVDATPPRADGIPFRPIDHTLETIPNFECSVPSWTEDHLVHLRVVVLDAREDIQLFLEDWAVRLSKCVKRQPTGQPRLQCKGWWLWAQSGGCQPRPLHGVYVFTKL